MIYRILYFFIKPIVYIVLMLLPVEAFVRMVYFLPSRLVVLILKHLGATIGENVRVAVPITFHGLDNESKKPFSNLVVGNNVYIGRETFLDLTDQIVLEDNVTLAMQVMIITHTNVGESPIKNRLPEMQHPVRIKSGAYLGARVTVLEDITIGQQSIIAAGAVVTQSVPEHMLCGGVPAKQIKNLL